MPIETSQVKDAVNFLFVSDEERDRAFSNQAFTDEIDRAIAYVNSGSSLDAEYFNRILISCFLGPVAQETFTRYFPLGINSMEKLTEGLMAFAKDALLHFGSFHQAFLRMKADPSLLPRVERTFGSETRAPFMLGQPIATGQLAYLGYVSGELPVRMSDAHKVLMDLCIEVKGLLSAESLRAAASEKKVDLEKLFATLNEGLRARAQEQVTIDSYLEEKGKLQETIENFINEVRRCRLQGIKNQEQYINSAAEMDVYVATSMRDDRDYRDMKEFVDAVFGRKDIARLHLRYFDPTQAYCPNKYDKGLVECLMIRCAKLTIYCAQLQDTMGKDSELAITLGLGKPVIVYVPRGNTADEKAAYDKRARVFSDVHPLSLQVDQTTGNSNGIIVVRDAEQCSDVLYAIARNQMKVKVDRMTESDPLSGTSTTFWVLREEITGNRSVIRVASGWRHLRTAFWSAFRPDLHIQ